MTMSYYQIEPCAPPADYDDMRKFLSSHLFSFRNILFHKHELCNSAQLWRIYFWTPSPRWRTYALHQHLLWIYPDKICVVQYRLDRMIKCHLFTFNIPRHRLFTIPYDSFNWKIAANSQTAEKPELLTFNVYLITIWMAIANCQDTRLLPN